ncbi:ABC transporter ATP-binding protein [Corynebacterium marinum]|uniref:Trehalose import ATP-binding protein SugC n=1 Tax=Corynebacterium marinum DSM 44953 TaxID=1224162 RepID=A0A0B6TJN1_9CORY|nr:ATP-binding cassette domain-containing protein [Corynebacterium marinum]AJK68158.1 ATP-binding transport protein SmoK [Corynebacterium marinum DSM 44953]GGO10487.1 ABC transporter ATP-binding protein [Corynebacterium marinum]
MATVTFDKVSIRYPGAERPTVQDLDLEIKDGEFLVLVGPSGCGKSTTLRALAGLEEVDSGHLLIDGRDVTGVEPGDRDIAMVFQNYALYPHLSVAKNMGFALKLAKMPAKQIDDRVNNAAEMLGLQEFLDRKPKDLSGGQRQRVAMGRAIVRDPKVFLMDEPLSNLDAKLRVQTRAELAALQRRLGTTTVYVTHDQVEAMTMGDRVAVLKDGILQQVAPPRELYAEPVNEFVAGFIGSPSMNLFPGEGVTLGVRPEAMRVLRDADELPAGWSLKEGTVDLVEELGSESYVYATAEGVRLVARLGDREVPERGERLLLSFDPGAAHRFDPQTGDRL